MLHFSARVRGAVVCSIASFLGAAPALRSQVPDGFEEAWTLSTQRFEAALAAEGTVGGSLVFAHRGEIIGRHHFGLADRASARRVDQDTIYHWASITKLLTAISVMQLRDRERLSLDQPVLRYLPEVREVHNPFGSMEEVRLEHLITHSSGFRGSTFPWGGAEDWHPHEPTRWEQVAAMMPYSRIHFAPGSRYAYSNPAFSMLGRVVEEITGEDIEVHVAKNLFMPLSMTRSYFDHTPWHLLEHRSNNYWVEAGPEGERRVQASGLDFDTGATKGNGGLNAPVDDLLRFLGFWLGVGDTRHHDAVLARASLDEMWRPRFATGAEGLDEKMGMAFFLIDHAAPGGPARRFIGHTGSQKAFRSFVYVQPESKTAALYAVNSTPRGVPRAEWSLGEVRRDLFENVFPLFFNGP